MGGALRMPFSLLYIALTAVLVFLLHCMSDRKIQLSVIQKISYFVICISGILIGHYIMVITLEAEKSGKTFFEVLKTHEKEYADITAQLEKLGVENPANFFEHPANYCGLAAKKSARLAKKYRELMK